MEATSTPKDVEGLVVSWGCEVVVKTAVGDGDSDVG